MYIITCVCCVCVCVDAPSPLLGGNGHLVVFKPRSYQESSLGPFRPDSCCLVLQTGFDSCRSLCPVLLAAAAPRVDVVETDVAANLLLGRFQFVVPFAHNKNGLRWMGQRVRGGGEVLYS